ncbi:MAG TPA: exonuclease domain-containing protein [Longimicrobiales bacterium]
MVDPPLAAPLESLEYVVVDVETTGGAAKRDHRVTEIAAIRADGAGTTLEEFSTLIDPERPIPPFITALTGITDDMVRGAPRFAEIAPEVRRLLEGRIFVAHNAAFDWRFVSTELERAQGVGIEAPRLCTVRLARRLLPELPSRSLGALSDYFGIDNPARHRALGDARATVAVMHRLLERAAAQGIRYWHELETLFARRTPRRRTTTARSPSK